MSDKNPRSHASLFRTLLFARDAGICAECGLDCERTRTALLLMPKAERLAEMRRLGITDLRKSIWEGHHIVPLAEGGENTLANHRTLCVRCHGWVTAEQNRRYGRAAAVSEIGEFYG